MQPTSFPGRADARRNRERILVATRALLARSGAAVSMEAIATDAGVAVGTLYRHFPTKEALLQAVVEEKLRLLLDELSAAQHRVAEGGDAFDELARMFMILAQRQAEDQAVKAAVASVQPPARAQAEREEQRVARMIEELMAVARRQGMLRPDVTMADLGWLLQGLPGPAVDEATRTRCATVVLDGLRAHPLRDSRPE